MKLVMMLGLVVFQKFCLIKSILHDLMMAEGNDLLNRLDEVGWWNISPISPKRKLALGMKDGPKKKTKKKVEESESDSSSGEEGLDNEMEISLCTERTDCFRNPNRV